MAIAFDQIPAGTLVPFTYFEAAAAPTPYNASLKLLLVGHLNNQAGTRGTARYETPYILSQDTVASLFGYGSMLEAMYRVAKKTYPGIEIWGIAPEPQAGALPAQAVIHVAQVPTQNGNAAFHIAGYPVAIPVRKTDTQSAIASRLVDKINSQKNLPCVAIQDGTDPTFITLVCKWKGLSGESIRINLRAWGATEGGLAVQVFDASAFGNAAGNAPIGLALTAIGDQVFDVFAIGVNIVTSQLDYIEDFLDGVSGRWSPSKQLYGHAICTRMDTYANLVTLGAARNDPHTSILGVEGSETPPWEWTGALSALVTGHLAQPPEMSRPLQALQLKGVQPSPDMIDWFSQEERQALLDAGISVHRVERDRSVWIDRVVTTYQTNVWGDQDASWRDIETLFQMSFFIRYLKQRITSTYPRAALTDSPTGIPGFVSPGELYDLVVRVYYELEALGLVENANLFARVLRVERDALDANRVNMLVPIDVVNQFRILAARVETNLQLRDAVRIDA